MEEDTDIKKLLTEWQLSAYIPKFIENKITLEVLGLLDKQLIKELIPPIGDRALFVKNWEDWNILTKAVNLNVGLDFSDQVDFLNENHRLQDITNFMPSTPSSPCSSKGPPVITLDSPNVQSFVNPTSSTESVIITFENEKETETGLKDLLRSTLDGRGLLNLYEESGLLSNNGRRKVCNIIIKHLLEADPSARIAGSTLLDYAKQITEVFKKENISTYFIPYISNSQLKIRRLAKGKLYDCLQNRKREFRVAAQNKTSTTCKGDSRDQESIQYSGATEDIEWLKNSCDPWSSVVDKWHRTADIRRDEILKNPEPVACYMTTYPALKKPAGFHLLTYDFKYQYPDSSEKLTENFPLYKNRILELAIQRFARHPDRNTREFIEGYVEIKNEESASANTEVASIYAFLSLPLLLGNPFGKNKKTTRRPSKQESQEAFITIVKASTELQSTISTRKDKYAKNGLTFQPTIFIVGPSIKEIQNYYIVVDDIFYNVHSIMEAVDTTFKLFHALHCEYPVECISVYSFLQKGIYGISTKWDKDFTCVNALMADLNIK